MQCNTSRQISLTLKSMSRPFVLNWLKEHHNIGCTAQLQIRCSFSAKKCWYYSYYATKIYVVVLIRSTLMRCLYSLEAPQWGTSNEYPQHMFLWRNKRNIFQIPPPPLFAAMCWYVWGWWCVVWANWFVWCSVFRVVSLSTEFLSRPYLLNWLEEHHLLYEKIKSPVKWKNSKQYLQNYCPWY